MKPKSAPRSRLLATLEEAIKKAGNPIEAQCLRAERAALLARQGQLERAQGAIDELNSQLAWQPHNNLVRGWVALAEGLHGYYSVIGVGGREQMELAYKLAHDSGAAGTRLRATTAAWLANLEFGDSDASRMVALVREALDTAAPEHRGARARATLVAGFAYHFGGDSARAQPWYEASRRHAIAEGDEAHLSALMHNQAWMRGAQARMALLFDTPSHDGGDSQAMTQALMGAESIGHYDAGIGTASLGSLVPMLRAQVLTAHGRWAEALDLFAANFDSALGEGLKRFAACLLADRAWCEWHEGRADKARALAGAAEQALAEPIDTDDRAMALARLAQVREVLGERGVATQHRDESQRLHAQHRDQQQRIVALLDEALVGLDPKLL
jgi:ATP/maltotriose-dependent transcriptional regulator MalT